MMTRILRFAIHQRLLMFLLAIGLIALGAWNFTRLPIDAVPDITNKQVQINTAITQMDQVTQSNSASAEESASAAEELDAQAALVLA